jgi:hypothetical protein
MVFKSIQHLPRLSGTARALLWTGLAAAALCASGCASAGKALGVSKTVPDEFRVVAQAPLVVPPDYSLRPPSPGQPRPQELDPEATARASLLGQAAGAQRSQGETLLVAKAGGDKVDPAIKNVVDDEFGDVAHKDKSFADSVMFWKKGPPTSDAAQAAAQSSPVNAAAEDARIKALTGAKPIIIARSKQGKVKLPGL